MPRDYKRSNRNKKASAPSPWKWLASGFGLGIVAAALMYWNLTKDQTTAPEPGTASMPQSSAESDAQTEDSAPKPVKPKSQPAQNSLPAPGDDPYTFYETLPNTEIVVSDQDNQPVTRSPSARSAKPRTTSQEPPANYILQAGSFKKFTDADRRKAQLAFKGIESNIQQVVLREEEIWYRVYVGPSKDFAALEDMRSTLRKADIDVLILKLRK